MLQWAETGNKCVQICVGAGYKAKKEWGDNTKNSVRKMSCKDVT